MKGSVGLNNRAVEVLVVDWFSWSIERDFFWRWTEAGIELHSPQDGIFTPTSIEERYRREVRVGS